MCHDKSPLARFLSSLGVGSASGVAKASPGIVVTGLSIYGHPIEHWISLLTFIYLGCMIVGSLPRVIHGLLYVFRLACPRKVHKCFHQVETNKEVQAKIDKYHK